MTVSVVVAVRVPHADNPPIVHLGARRIDFLRPVYSGDTITATLTITGLGAALRRTRAPVSNHSAIHIVKSCPVIPPAASEGRKSLYNAKINLLCSRSSGCMGTAVACTHLSPLTGARADPSGALAAPEAVQSKALGGGKQHTLMTATCDFVNQARHLPPTNLAALCVARRRAT